MGHHEQYYWCLLCPSIVPQHTLLMLPCAPCLYPHEETLKQFHATLIQIKIVQILWIGWIKFKNKSHIINILLLKHENVHWTYHIISRLQLKHENIHLHLTYCHYLYIFKHLSTCMEFIDLNNVHVHSYTMWNLDVFIVPRIMFTEPHYMAIVPHLYDHCTPLLVHYEQFLKFL